MVQIPDSELSRVVQNHNLTPSEALVFYADMGMLIQPHENELLSNHDLVRTVRHSVWRKIDCAS